MTRPKRYPPVVARFPHMLHGGDYNPDQWIDTPEVWHEDMRLAGLARCNAMSVGIFSWTSLEPDEGRFTFDWLDRIMDLLADNNRVAVLATPSGAKPAWLSAAYPEIRRVNARRERELHGGRHNHCFSSPVYREKTALVNDKLAARYADRPALALWHVSNEYGGECHCDLCQQAFRHWLRTRYHDDLDALNRAWWTRFWSHAYTDFEQIESPSPIGEQSVHGLNLDWKRFVTHQTIDFFKNEIAPLRRHTPDTPVTTNFMGAYPGLDYRRFAEHVDVISWDSYPPYHDRDDDWRHAVQVSFMHNLNRSLKGGRPFMLMECSPSVQNWKPVNKLKRPGVHYTEAMQAVAHGSESVQYFQWRKSRGACEKFHGAVVDHTCHEHTRVFGEVSEVGHALSRLDDVLGATVPADVAVVYDWENRWAIDDTRGPRNERKDYVDRCVAHYRPLWSMGVPADVIGEDDSLDGYKLVVAPMLYMVRPGVAERIEAFVRGGGVFVTTYLSGVADETDLCFLGGFPGPLRKLMGVWAEEIDVLYDDESVPVRALPGNAAGLTGTYEARLFCDLIHAEAAEVAAEYAGEFYAGRPALTVNRVGAGEAWYVASRNDDAFLTDFYSALVRRLSIRRTLPAALPQGVTAHFRTDGTTDYVFVMNFTRDPQQVDLGDEPMTDMIDGKALKGQIALPGYATKILKRPAVPTGLNV